MKRSDTPEATLCFLIREQSFPQVLLGWKKIGFGKGKYGGFGGKVERGETIEQAARRELLEETSIQVSLEALQQAARLLFLFPYRREWNQVVYAFLAKEWEGEALESDEMQPGWWAVDRIPYERMWADTAYWLPLVLEGKRLQATFSFNQDNETIYFMEIQE